MRTIAHLLLAVALLACAGCDAKGSANGSASEHGGRGIARLGIPF